MMSATVFLKIGFDNIIAKNVRFFNPGDFDLCAKLQIFRVGQEQE